MCTTWNCRPAKRRRLIFWVVLRGGSGAPHGTEHQAVVLNAADLAVGSVRRSAWITASDARACRPPPRVAPHGLADQLPGSRIGEQQRAAEAGVFGEQRDCRVPERLDDVVKPLTA